LAKVLKQQIAIAGALAYDQIANTNRALDSNSLRNCKLLDLAERFGGCGGNIAYNLSQLGYPPFLLSCIGGIDEQPYLRHMADCGIDTRYCVRVPQTHTARAIIFTDPAGDQFTGFYPGPTPNITTWRAQLQQADAQNIHTFVQAPYPGELMAAGLQHFQQSNHNVLNIWVPGQYADQLEASEIMTLVDMADWIIGNHYEINCLTQHKSLQDKMVITTHGPGPVSISSPTQSTVTYAVPEVDDPKDPTGCGDAFIAGLVAHVAATRRQNLSSPGNLASLLSGIALGCKAAAACLRVSGAQQHALSPLG
jgi:adenosine kinase